MQQNPFYDVKRINHTVVFSLNGACTNQAESYFSRLRRAELGQHQQISGKYLAAYAVEAAWREDTRRKSNGTLHALVTGGGAEASGVAGLERILAAVSPRVRKAPLLPLWAVG